MRTAVALTLGIALLIPVPSPHGYADERHYATADSITSQESKSKPIGKLAGHPIHSLEVKQLRWKGLKDPIEQLVVSLQKHLELISEAPAETRLRFWVERIHVLNGQWVYAYFEDGHVPGEGIFEYTVEADSTISWRRLAVVEP